VPLTAADCGPSVPPLLTALTVYEYVVLAASPVSVKEVVLLLLVALPDRYMLYDEAPLTAFQLMVIPACDCPVTLSLAGVAKSGVLPLATADRSLHPVPLPAITVK
jgi:hypothetical protein